MEVKPDTLNTSSNEDATSQKQEAFTHLAQGKRHLLVKDYDEAVTSLAQACRLLSEQYGELANECGDAYFNYGKALLELARTENGVLGDAIEGEHDEDDDDDDDDEADDKNEEQVENGDDENDDGHDQKEESVKKETQESNGDGSSNDCSQKDEDDDSNLKLAWETLELAKIIFERQADGNKQLSLKLAEVYLKLGEVSLESENCEQGIEDIQSCLKIQTLNLPEDSRFIAETHYQLGVAYSLNSEFDKAIEQFVNAAKLLEKRIENLESRKRAGGDCTEETETDPFYSLDDEIAELKELLPEVKEKVADMKDFKKEALKAVCGELGQRFSGGADGASGSGSSAVAIASQPVSLEAKPVSNISHLVRKKRKPDDTSENDKGTEAAIVPAKQAKTE